MDRDLNLPNKDSNIAVYRNNEERVESDTFQDIDYKLNRQEINEKWFFGQEGFTIASDFNSQNKKSMWFIDCLGIIFVWEDDKSSTLSFLSSLAHVVIAPWGKMLKDDQIVKETTTWIVHEILEHFLEKTKDWSREVIILWWKHYNQFPLDSKRNALNMNYDYTIEYLSRIIKERIWINPTIANPTNTLMYETNIYFINNTRTLHIHDLNEITSQFANSSPEIKTLLSIKHC